MPSTVLRKGQEGRMNHDSNAPPVGAQPGLRVLAGMSPPLRVGVSGRGRGASGSDLGSPPPASRAERAQTTNLPARKPGTVSPRRRRPGVRPSRTPRIVVQKVWLASDPDLARAAESAAAERILARLVSRAYAASHSHLFGRPISQSCAATPAAGIQPHGADHTISGPSSAARADAVAPAAKDGGPEHSWSLEHDQTESFVNGS